MSFNELSDWQHQWLQNRALGSDGLLHRMTASENGESDLLTLVSICVKYARRSELSYSNGPYIGGLYGLCPHCESLITGAPPDETRLQIEYVPDGFYSEGIVAHPKLTLDASMFEFAPWSSEQELTELSLMLTAAVRE